MKRKFKFVSLVLSMVMCFTLMVLGVYAATTSSLSVNNRVSFEAFDQVDCVVSYEIVGAQLEEGASASSTLATFVAGAEQGSAETAIGPVAIPDCTFVKELDDNGDVTGKVNDITISIIFTNNNATSDLTVTWNWASANFNGTEDGISATGSLTGTEEQSITVGAGSSETLTLTYSVNDPMNITEQLDASFTELLFVLTAVQR